MENPCYQIPVVAGASGGRGWDIASPDGRLYVPPDPDRDEKVNAIFKLTPEMDVWDLDDQIRLW